MVTNVRPSSRGIARMVDDCIKATSPIYSDGGASPGAVTLQTGSTSGEPSTTAGTVEAVTGGGSNNSALRYSPQIFIPRSQRQVQMETLAALDDITNVAMFIGFVGRHSSGDDLRDLYSESSNAITIAEADLAGIVFDTGFTDKGGEFFYLVAGGEAGTRLVRSGIVVRSDTFYGFKVDAFNSGGVRMSINERGHADGEPFQLAGAIDPGERFAAYNLLHTHAGVSRSIFYKRHLLQYGL